MEGEPQVQQPQPGNQPTQGLFPLPTGEFDPHAVLNAQGQPGEIVCIRDWSAFGARVRRRRRPLQLTDESRRCTTNASTDTW